MPKPKQHPSQPAAAPTGRYLRKFTIDGVKTFRSRQELDFCDENGQPHQWTVILGENGTGKTTLLQYIAGLMPVQRVVPYGEAKEGTSHVTFCFRPLMADPEWVDRFYRDATRERQGPVSSISAELEISAPSRSLSAASDSESEDDKLGITVSFGDGELYRSILPNVSGSGPQSAFAHFPLFAYGAGRHVAGPSSPFLASGSALEENDIAPIRTLFQDDIPLISPEQWLRGLDYRSRMNGENGSRAELLLKHARRSLVEALHDVTDVLIEEHRFASFVDPVSVGFQTPYAKEPIEFSGLSLGCRTMAAWVVDFLARMQQWYPNSDNPAKHPAVVIIDEFDLHLHPSWQASAMESLSRLFPNTQFIVTAHSPLVVQATEGKAKIVVLRRQTGPDGIDEVDIDDDPAYSAGWRVDQILTSSLYGLESSRSPEFTRLMEEMVKLRQQDDLSPPEQDRLRELDAILEAKAPTGMSSASASLLADVVRALQENP